MLEDQVAYLLQRYLGNYVRGLNKEALKISVWNGDVELTNMQLKPEALNALKLPVKVKAGFLGSVKLKVPWSRLGQDPVVVYLDRIFLLAEPATQVEGRDEDAVQEAKKSRVREMEMKLLEKAQQMKLEVNQSWLGSLISTIIGNLKLSISNIHIRYEDLESNPGHPFAAGLTLGKLSAATIDETGVETFATGAALDHIQKHVELDQLALYLDSDVSPWHMDKAWENLLPSEWVLVFQFGTEDGKPAEHITRKHSYILQPVSGNAKYIKMRPGGSAQNGQPQQKAAVSLDDVTLCLSKGGYRDILKLADNFAAFNQRLRYAHYRPNVSVKSDPRSWWKYALKATSDQIKKASGKLSWEQLLRYASLRKKYISLYASLLKADPNLAVVDGNKEIEELDRELDIDLILQWRMLAHRFVGQTIESNVNSKKQKAKKSWWSFGRNNQSLGEEGEQFRFTDEDWEQLNKLIGYKEGDDVQPMVVNEKMDSLHTYLEINMNHNASKLLDESDKCLAELSCDGLDCSIKLYPETKVFHMKLGSYCLSSPNGLLAESATACDSLIGVFCYKPFDVKVDWSMVAKASPCYMTYLKDSIDGIVNFFESNASVSQTIALETAAAVQMTIDEVKRTAQQQVNRALKDHTRFLLDLDIAAPKITIPTEFHPDNVHSTKLLLDLGNLVIRSKDDSGKSNGELDMYLQFDLVMSDVSAFLVDGDYSWSQSSLQPYSNSGKSSVVNFLPVIDKCGMILRLQQLQIVNPTYPSTRVAVRLPAFRFHFSPARYHRLMQVAKVFQENDNDKSDVIHPWNQADHAGWMYLLNRKGMGNRAAVWQWRYFFLVGPFLYILENPGAKSYKQYHRLRGKQLHLLPGESIGGMEHVLVICDGFRSTNKVVEDANAVIIRFDSEDELSNWQSRLQGAIYKASGSSPITSLSETSSDNGDPEPENNDSPNGSDALKIEHIFITGILDELKICFNYSFQREQNIVKVLLAEERRLFEFRARGGKVELSLRDNDMFIGTALKSLEIEDLVCSSSPSKPRFLARSFIYGEDIHPFPDPAGHEGLDDKTAALNESDDKFYEASESLVDSEFPNFQNPLPFENSLFSPPSFNRAAGLLPGYSVQSNVEDFQLDSTLNSFVKAQIVICDQNSSQYNNVDMQVMLTLDTLSFSCRRPTIIAILEFVNAINADGEKLESFIDNSSAKTIDNDTSREDADCDQYLATEEPVVKGLLGKGKSRVIFNLILNMVRAQIVLMSEKETKLVTLSQDNLLTDIKVFPNSFSIKASLGNLKISDDCLPESHSYFWICDMRNPGGSSFVELVFTSFSIDDEDYEGFEYSLFGQLSEVRIVYLNRFIQEVVSYFTGLLPNSPRDIVKLKDKVTNSEKWFTTSEIEGSPALKLDITLTKPIILMPRNTDSLDYLKLDVFHITLQNTFQWFGGGKAEISAVHLEILTIKVQDINLNIGSGGDLGESIIQDVKGVSVVIRRSLRDLLHQMPSAEAAIKIEELKAALSSREYQIVTECAVSNISEAPRAVPPLNLGSARSFPDVVEPVGLSAPADNGHEITNSVVWISIKVAVMINLVELRLYAGVARDTSLASLQVNSAWLLYKSNNIGDGFLSATLKGLNVVDDREGTEEELRLAIGNPEKIVYGDLCSLTENQYSHLADVDVTPGIEIKPVPSMLVLDAKFGQSSTFVAVCVQRPRLLVALDFLLAVLEFFVPTVGGMLSNEENRNLACITDAIILDQPVYIQPCAQFSLSPMRPLIVEDESFDHFIYDGHGGVLLLKDRRGFDLSAPSEGAIIYIASGKKLQFKNVVIKNGRYLDSCISLGSNSGYSVSTDDNVYLEEKDEACQEGPSRESRNYSKRTDASFSAASEIIIELQAIGPELTFYNTSKEVGMSPVLSNQLLHAQLDAFSRIVMKSDTMEMTVNALGLMMESNGIRILEPFDTFVKYSNASGKTKIHLTVTDIFMNFTFSILKLFLAVEEDILEFMTMTSKETTIACSHFDKVGTIWNPESDQVYAFWRPRAPPGYAVVGDYLTPLDKPPTKGVLAVNINIVKVKRPVSFNLIWPSLTSKEVSDFGEMSSNKMPNGGCEGNDCCSIWFPVAPRGYVSLGCVVSPGREPPSLSSTFCILASLVSPCSLRDCITIRSTNQYPSPLAFWRVNNSIGSFLPADPLTLSLIATAYELRHIKYGFPEVSTDPSTHSSGQVSPPHPLQTNQSGLSTSENSTRCFEVVASFQLIWWNRTSNLRKKISIWRPVVPHGMVYFGDITVEGYEPPNSSIVLHDTEDQLFKSPLDYQLVGQIKKWRGIENISFWMPLAPPGYVSLGCIACKGSPKQYDFSKLRCIRSDMVTKAYFLEESLWETSDAKLTKETFSIWVVANEMSTFIVRSSFKKPPGRVAMKLADLNVQSNSDDTVVDASISTFSAAIFDDYGGLMVPLCNISLSGIEFSLHGRAEYLNSTVSFSLICRSYNDKHEAWEPLVESVDGFLRYQYDHNAPGAASQLRITSTRDLNLNISVSNVNMIIQAYSSWSSLGPVHESYKRNDTLSPTHYVRSTTDIHHKRNYYIIPQNKLGQDIYIRVIEGRGLSHMLRMPSGDAKPVKVSVSKNMMDAHLKGNLCAKVRRMLTVVVADAQLPRVGGSTSNLYTATIRLTPTQNLGSESLVHQQSARTSGSISNSSHIEVVNWGEIFFFRVDSLEIYSLELIVTDVGKGDLVGIYSAPLQQIAQTIQEKYDQVDYLNYLTWIDLSLARSMVITEGSKREHSSGRLRFAVLVPAVSGNDLLFDGRNSGDIHISPSFEGPWTRVRLNYAARAACWRLGNDVVASEVSVQDGNRYVNIRSLVSVKNNTDFKIDVRLVYRACHENIHKDTSECKNLSSDSCRVQTDEFFETEKYDPSIGWVGCSNQSNSGGYNSNAVSGHELQPGWEWIDNWHLDMSCTKTAYGWVYSPDVESLKWPESFDLGDSVNQARQRRWIRNRKQIAKTAKEEIDVGLLEPGSTVPLPLPGLSQSGLYVFQLRPSNQEEYSWSSVVDRPGQQKELGKPNSNPEICVSALLESEELLCCTQMSSSSSSGLPKLWFCVSIEATEISKDIHSEPIQDWTLVIKSPLSITNYLPLAAEYSILDMQASGHFVGCARGVVFRGKTTKIHTADIRNPLFLSLLPQRGWLPVHDAILITQPHGFPSKTMSLRSATSGRIVQLILDQNYEKERPLMEKSVRVYAPYWFSIARCPPLAFRLVHLSGKKQERKIRLLFQPKTNSDIFIGEITEEELCEGHTMASSLNFNLLGLSVSITQSGDEQHFGSIKELSALSDMDGSLDLYAHGANGCCMRLFISTKPCPYQSVPTKVISVRPFTTFTNRLGQDLWMRLNGEDEPKALHASDARISFLCRASGESDNLQVRLEDTEWSYPVQIVKEDTIFLVLRRQDGTRKILRTEIRGFEEGSRFIVVFRLGPVDGPFRIENRTFSKKISIRQSGFGEDAWIKLEPLSTINFSWEDPYGQKFLDAKVDTNVTSGLWKLDLERIGMPPAQDIEIGLQFIVAEMGELKVARFSDYQGSISGKENRFLMTARNWGNSSLQNDTQNSTTPLEIIVELGVVGISIVDHKPKELSYLYCERVFISYLTGHDGGKTSRFKLIFGYSQIDNQLPLTLMPVLLSPEQAANVHNPVFKMTITMRNENPNGIVVYPYIYVRVTERVWRIDIHEPIIWESVNFYNNLQLDRLPQSSTVTQVDPEIHIELIDISEIRLKVSLETAPAQRPHGILGVWSPILSAIGNAFKFQVHLRRVMHRDRYVRKSSIIPAIENRIWRDLIHNPLHLILSVDVLGMTSSTLASLSKGFAELSTDGQFLQLRSKQVGSRRITGVGDGIIQGTEALAQGFAFGISGVVTKPVESARQSGLVGLVHGLGHAFLGVIVQPVSGALDFFSLTVDGIGASCSKCLEVLSNKLSSKRIRNPRPIHADGILREYSEREAVGQMILYLAEASRQLGCTEIFKEPSKFAWSDCYEEHFVVPYQMIVLVSNKRVMLLQSSALDKLDMKPCKIMWDVPWEKLLSLELAKAGCTEPSHLLLHLKNFRRSEKFVRVIKCYFEEESAGREPQAVRICSVVRRVWKAYQSDMRTIVLKVPSSQRHVYFSGNEAGGRDPYNTNKTIIKSRELSSSSSLSEGRFVKHTMNFMKLWSSERESKGRCRMCRKQVAVDGPVCSIWRPICPDGYVSIGDIAHIGTHPPNVAALYQNRDGLFSLPLGYDLVWRNCSDDYKTPVSIWHPRAPDGFIAPGYIAVANFEEPEPNLVYCVAESMIEETEFEEQKVWSSPDAYPWACHIYQVQSDALHFVALRQRKEESDWKPMRVVDAEPRLQSPKAQEM